LGAGSGKELKQLAEHGCVAIGLDVDATALADCRRANLPVVLAPAEHMPLRAQAFDGLICNVAIPYTDESQVMQEIGRILKRGGARGICATMDSVIFCDMRWPDRVSACASMECGRCSIRGSTA